ncbi:type I restriction endonuclease subunit R [Senegalia sp. (in: firmicutes)]|uniref:type I restriction endonuclease subunit R n=1 Tax=Senegalia sp. (in: firmicutes) TaxID=1924098 RepID=UPI003F9709C2
MGNHKKTSSERNFQERFVRELEKYRWIAPDELNGNKKKVTEDDLIAHWRGELNRINADQLEGVPLTDTEFAQVLSKVNAIDNSFEAAKILAMEGSIGKIDGIYRDDNPKVTRKQITLTIFKKAEVRGGDSSYKIAREITTSNNNRFDIVLLINGLPLINIEQKRADKTLDEAFGQFKRYYRDGEYINNFFVFSQMMVITSEVATRYFATPKSINDFNLSFVFGWANKNNRPVNNWQDIVAQFLMIPMAHQLVGDYLIIDEAEEEENKRHMIMRSYQVYALQAVEGAAFGWDNKEKIPHGGYVWHTTGSGKTITSFKTALFLSTRGGFDKVIFLVDRRELDKKTSENFKAYAAYESVSVDDTKHTYLLRKQLLSPRKGIVVTTTFKLNSLVKDLVEAKDFTFSNKKIIFIIDEAHRTTMGQMMGNIKDYFKKNGLFYGFTGTPLFDENEITGMVNEKSEVIDTTEKLFGPELHKYTIDEAIADGNVLGFHVDYINTGEFLNHEDLKEQIKEQIQEEKPDMTGLEIERMVQGWNNAQVEKEATKRKILIYHDGTHIARVVKEILSNWEEQSQKMTFNAILTVAYKDRVIKYYNEFKEQLKSNEYKINIAMTFSFGNENDVDNIPVEIIETMFKDYGEFTGIEFICGDRKRGEDAYFEDIVARGTRGGSGRNKKNIDLIIVADQLLTGYDSKFLNTLYVDRSLELQGLIQAYSRTNRIYGKNKEFGTIVNFKYPKITEEQVNRALRLYGSGGSSSRVIVEHYISAVEKFSLKIKEMIKALPDPTEWENLKTNSERKELFILSFKDANEQLRLVMQYYEFKWDEESFDIDEHTWLKYVGAYKNLIYKESMPYEDEPIMPLVGKTKLSASQVIDANHILNLIGNKVRAEKGIQTIDEETLRIIYQEIQELSNVGEDEQAKLLKEFVETELVPGNLPSDLNFDELYEKWKNKKVEKEISKFSQEWGIDQSLLSKSVDHFSIVEEDSIPYITEISANVDFNKATKQEARSQLEHTMKLLNEALPQWLIEVKKKYN